jgi:HlyD family secretion protein
LVSKKIIRRIAVLAAIAIAIVAALQWTGRPRPVAVTVAESERGPVESTVVNTRAGTVDACQRAGLSPAVGGQISTLPVKEGDAVEPDQVLMELWNVDRRAELELSRRDAVAAKGRAREACVIADVAGKEARRLTSLHKQGLASEESAERAEGDALARSAACDAANDATRVAQARVDVSLASVERTILRAPFAGVIAEINGELGEFVTPSPVGIPTPPTVDLIDGSCLYITAPIDEIDAPAVRAGMDARISLDAFPGRKFPGFVRRVAPYVMDMEKQARTVDVEAEIRDAGGEPLLPGYSADVEVILDQRENVIRAPTQAILDGNRVFILNELEGVAVERSVEIGAQNWEHTEIISGLTAGELVITSVDRAGLADGARAVRE